MSILISQVGIAHYTQIRSRMEEIAGIRQRAVCLNNPVSLSQVLWCKVERSMLASRVDPQDSGVAYPW